VIRFAMDSILPSEEIPSRQGEFSGFRFHEVPVRRVDIHGSASSYDIIRNRVHNFHQPIGARAYVQIPRACMSLPSPQMPLWNSVRALAAGFSFLDSRNEIGLLAFRRSFVPSL
jgi:hypothetical protein